MQLCTLAAVVVGEIRRHPARHLVFHGDVMNTAARLKKPQPARLGVISHVTVRPRDWVPVEKDGPRKVWERVQPSRENLSLLRYSDCHLGDRPVSGFAMATALGNDHCLRAA